MDLRQKLLTKGEVKKELVKITCDDGEVLEVEVRGLGSFDRGRLMTEATYTPEGSEETVVDLAKLSPQLILMCSFDPVSGAKLFSAADIEAIGITAATFLDPIINTASRLSGMSTGARKEAEGNSAPTTTSASDSLSPAS